jgi:hypothetical protein
VELDERDGPLELELELLEPLRLGELLELLPPEPRTSLRTLSSLPAHARAGASQANAMQLSHTAGPIHRPRLAIVVFRMTCETPRR